MAVAILVSSSEGLCRDGLLGAILFIAVAMMNDRCYESGNGAVGDQLDVHAT